MRTLFYILLLIFLSVPQHAVQARTIELNGMNTVIFNDSIDMSTVDTMAAAIMGKRIMLDEAETLYVIIVSNGGDYAASQKLVQFLNVVPNMQLICKYCASAAGMVFATFSNHNRLITESSELLMHEMYIPRVTAKMIANPAIAPDLIRDSTAFNSLMCKVMGIDLKTYEKNITETNWIIKGKALVKHKLADELVVLKCNEYIKLLAPNTCKN